MPAAIVAGVAVVFVVFLYFYFAQYIIQDTNAKLDEAKAPIGEFPVVGGWIVGAIGWVQSKLWILRGIFIAEQQSAVNWASGQIAWAIASVVDHFDSSNLWNHIRWLDQIASFSYDQVTHWISTEILYLLDYSRWTRTVADEAHGLAYGANQAIGGWITDSINLLIRNTGAIYGIAIDAQQMGRLALIALATWVPGRLDSLERWKDQEQTQVLPRIQADVNTRARTIDVDVLQQRVIALERAVTVLLALGVLAGEGAQAIENLRCISKVDCGTLSDLADCDVCDRLNALEIAV